MDRRTGEGVDRVGDPLPDEGLDLGDREPLTALAETPARIRSLVESWNEQDFERSYAPGKWPARKILAHLAQAELALTTRARFALTVENYQAHCRYWESWCLDRPYSR